jgi:hypothetical protein
MAWRSRALTGIGLLALATACSGVDASLGIRADGGAPDAVASASGSDSSSNSGSSSGSAAGSGSSGGGSSSSSGGTTPDASSADDAGWNRDPGGSQDSGAPPEAGLPPQDAGTAICTNDPFHAEEAVAAIANGKPVTCATLICPAGQCCFVQPSPFNVCVTQ